MKNLKMFRIRGLSLILFLFLCTIGAWAQSEPYVVKGTVCDEYRRLSNTAVLLKSSSDSTSVGGCITDGKGRFSMKVSSAGDYVLEISYLGYKTKKIKLKITTQKKEYDNGRIVLEEDAVLIGETVITGEAPAVSISNDTTIFNADSFRGKEGAVLGELIDKMPGISVDNDGSIMFNGKKVEKIMVDGKDFFEDDPEIVLKNLPSEAVEKIKSYDRKTDEARVTGIDDGVEVTVLDVQVKDGMKKGWFGNIEGGYGTDDKYDAGAMLNRFKHDNNLSVVASFTNTQDDDISRAIRNAGGGVNSVVMAGLNGNVRTEKVDFNGDVHFRRNRTEVETKRNMEMYHSEDIASLTRSEDESDSYNNAIVANFKLEWKPDSMTDIHFAPKFRYATAGSNSAGASDMFEDEMHVNSKISLSEAYDRKLELSGRLHVNRKFRKKGRNLMLAADFSHNDGNGDDRMLSTMFFYKADSISISDRMTVDDNWGNNFNVKVTYTEPLWEKAFLRLSYKFSDRNSYSSRFPERKYAMAVWKDSASNETKNRYVENEMRVELRYMGDKYSYSIGGAAVPQSSVTEVLAGLNKREPLSQVIWNFSPTVDFMVKYSKQRKLHLSYRGYSKAPSVLDMSETIDISDPMNMRFGNPSLKPMFVNRFVMSFSDYNMAAQRSMMLNLVAGNTTNGKTYRITYDSKTGARQSFVENINGNWNANAFFFFNSALKNKKFNVSASTNAGYRQAVGFSSVMSDSDKAPKSYTHYFNFSQNASFSYRNDNLFFSCGGDFRYAGTVNNMNESNERKTFDYTLFSELNVELPWDLSLAANLNYFIRRGYSGGFDDSFLLWNMQLSKAFLKKKQAIVMVKAFDILQQQANRTRTIGFNYILDTETNAVGSYVMVQFIYRLNNFTPPRQARPGMPPRRMR